MPGKRLDENQKLFVQNLVSYFQRELENGGPLLPLNCVYERVANALGISINTVGLISRKYHEINPPAPNAPAADASEDDAPLDNAPAPDRKKESKFSYSPRKKWKTSDLPEAVKMEIKKTVYDMYAAGKHFTLATLNEELQLKEILRVGMTSLYHILKEIGFSYKKHNNRVALMEQQDVVFRRAEFLRQYMINKNSPFKRQVIFLDETWIFAKGSTKRSWQDGTSKGVRRPKGGEGKRFIILHAGHEGGFVENASLIFATKSKLADYHGDMNGELFERWVADKLVPNLEEPSLIVMDNASYHSAVIEHHPTSAWTKPKIEEWLKEHNINYTRGMFKSELLALARFHTPPKRYKVDEYLQQHGHEVLRLPPYHCQFNAIELIWAQAKGYYYSHMGEEGYGDQKVLEMWEKALNICTQDRWNSVVKHTEKIIDEWYQNTLIIADVPELIIHLGGDSSDEDEF